MKRILHMTPPILNNGIYKYIFGNLEYIDRSQYQFEFLTQNREGLMETDEYRKYRFPIQKISTTQRHSPERFRREIEKILSDGYDVLQLHTSYWRGFLIEEIAMELGIPKVIVHSHSTGIDVSDDQERASRLAVHESLKDQFDERYATHFWSCSHMAADWLFGKQIDRTKIRILPNAIDLQRYGYRNDIRERKRAQLGLEHKFVMGNTGRFEYQKNHEFLLRVFVKVYKRNPAARLLLAGEGENMDKIRNMAEEAGVSQAILFLGWREDVDELLQAMDVYCLPSWFEGFPIVLIEAQAAGLQCMVSSLVTNEASITECIHRMDLEEDNWVRAIEALADGYERQDTTAQLRAAGYDLPEQARALEKLYDE